MMNLHVLEFKIRMCTKRARYVKHSHHTFNIQNLVTLITFAENMIVSNAQKTSWDNCIKRRKSMFTLFVIHRAQLEWSPYQQHIKYGTQLCNHKDWEHPCSHDALVANIPTQTTRDAYHKQVLLLLTRLERVKSIPQVVVQSMERKLTS